MSNELLDALIEKLRGGDAEAAEELLRQYEPILRLVVRRQLSPSLRSKFDSVDIVQSVWADVFDGFRHADWHFADADHLRAFLVKSTRNRFINRARQQRPAISLQDSSDEALEQKASDSAGSPSDELEAEELWDRMLTLCPPEHRELLDLRRQGHSYAEIAEQTGLHPSSVRRILYQLARRLAVKP